MDAAVVEFTDGLKVKKIVRVSAIIVGSTKAPFKPKAATDFKTETGYYKVKWQKSDLNHSGYYDATIMLLAKSIEDAKSKADALGIKFLGPPVLELPASKDVKSPKSGQEGSIVRRTRPPSVTSSKPVTAPVKQKIVNSKKKSKSTSTKSSKHTEPLKVEKPKPNRDAKDPVVLKRMDDALKAAQSNPLLHVPSTKSDVNNNGSGKDEESGMISPVHKFAGSGNQQQLCFEGAKRKRSGDDVLLDASLDSSSSKKVKGPNHSKTSFSGENSGSHNMGLDNFGFNNDNLDFKNCESVNMDLENCGSENDLKNCGSDNDNDLENCGFDNMDFTVPLHVEKVLPTKDINSNGTEEANTSDILQGSQSEDYSSDSDDDDVVKLTKKIDNLKKKTKEQTREIKGLNDRLLLHEASVKLLNNVKFEQMKTIQTLESENKSLKKRLHQVHTISSIDLSPVPVSGAARKVSPEASVRKTLFADDSGDNLEFIESNALATSTPNAKNKGEKCNRVPAKEKGVANDKSDKCSVPVNRNQKKKVPLIKQKGIEEVAMQLQKHKEDFLHKSSELSLPLDSAGMFVVQHSSKEASVDGKGFVNNVRKHYKSNLSTMTRNLTTLMWNSLERRARSLQGKSSNRYQDTKAKIPASPEKVDLILGTVKFTLRDLQGMEENDAMEMILKQQRTVIGNKLNQEDQKVKRMKKDQDE